MLRRNGRDAPPSGQTSKNVRSGVLDVGVPDGAEPGGLLLSDAIARARRQVVVGRLPKPHNSESLKSSISAQYLLITKLPSDTPALRAGLWAPAPGIPKAIDSRRVRCKSRRLRAPATHFPFSGPETWGEERNPRHRWVRKAARWARTYVQRPLIAGDR